jgi:phosphatidylglycerophosphate synthase
MKYKEIRKITKIKPINQELFFAYFFGRRLSPFFVNIFLKLNITPNTITVYMIRAGIIGAILFAFDNIWFKFTGYIFMLLWLILDCADGEVARITKVFSKFGKELDYIAHIINHPLFNVAFLISLIQLNKYNVILLAIISILFISSNLINRNLLSMYIIYDLKAKPKNAILNKQKMPRVILNYIINILIFFPNFVLLFPLMYFIDVSMGTFLSLLYFLIAAVSSVYFITRSAIKTVYKFTKE